MAELRAGGNVSASQLDLGALQIRVAAYALVGKVSFHR
jgi:hypothetical protein